MYKYVQILDNAEYSQAKNFEVSSQHKLLEKMNLIQAKRGWNFLKISAWNGNF